MKIWRYAAAFLGGALIAASVTGAVLSLDNSPGGSVSESAGSDIASDISSRGDDTGQVLATDGQCLTAADIYEAARPSVVEVDISVTQSGFFGAQRSTGAGSGVVLDAEGHILTNNHVVGDADTITVRFDDGDTTEATLLGTDPANDIAVIQVDPAAHDLKPATLGDSAALRVGDQVLAIGDPFNLEGTLTQGIVSALDRTHSNGGNGRPIRDMIQTDAAVNPGNSGGPLLNCEGHVVGINTLLENPTGESVNVGVAFAVSINTAKNELDSLIADAPVEHAWLGIRGEDVTPALAADLDLSVDEGVYVSLVDGGSPADRAGLVPAFGSESEAASASDPQAGGDVITKADGRSVSHIADLAAYIDSDKEPGDTIDLTVVRDGKEISVQATLADWPA